MTIVLIWRMNINNTQKRKKLIDKKTARTRWPLESKKSWRDFSQNLLVPSFSSAYLLPSSTFSGSNIWVFDTWILSMMIDIASASSGLAKAYSGTQSPLTGMEGRRYGGQRSSPNKVRMLDLFHFSSIRLGLHVWRSSSLLPCRKNFSSFVYIFIGPKSDHCLPLSIRQCITDWLLFSRFDWYKFGPDFVAKD